jgi:hypothetical protein
MDHQTEENLCDECAKLLDKAAGYARDLWVEAKNAPRTVPPPGAPGKRPPDEEFAQDPRLQEKLSQLLKSLEEVNDWRKKSQSGPLGLPNTKPPQSGSETPSWAAKLWLSEEPSEKPHKPKLGCIYERPDKVQDLLRDLRQAADLYANLACLFRRQDRK